MGFIISDYNFILDGVRLLLHYLYLIAFAFGFDFLHTIISYLNLIINQA
jgi:hypothetical protein